MNIPPQFDNYPRHRLFVEIYTGMICRLDKLLLQNSKIYQYINIFSHISSMQFYDLYKRIKSMHHRRNLNRVINNSDNISNSDNSYIEINRIKENSK